MKLTFAFCTFNRADRLEKLVSAMRAQECPVPFEILVVNNNSKDNTLEVLESLQRQPGAPLRIFTENAPGIVPARNRVLAEAHASEFLVFIDDDELPHPGLLNAAYDALENEAADCVGGRVDIDFATHGRPAWLGDDLLGFLAAIDHGGRAFWIKGEDTPVWTSNIAYRMAFLREHGLKFDARYNREGASASGSGGGEDVVMLRRLLALDAKIRYRPDMAVDHGVEAWRLRKHYFLRLHYLAGMRKGLHEYPDYPHKLFGVPPFLIMQALRQGMRALSMAVLARQGYLRQGMNATHALGLIRGLLKRQACTQNKI
ncbi:MAG: glycosyltransferase family 2 protein [Thiobacillus sp.]|nr:glycosyltransferase family 2 protein [Thiobacillus sp.]